jgi:hypothetical protein
MKKIFKYNGYTFNICITFNFSMEKRPGAQPFHKIEVNNVGGPIYTKEFMVNDIDLLSSVKEIENTIMKEYSLNMDDSPLSKIKTQLIMEGFA